MQKIKHGAYIINLDEYSDIGTHWVALYAQNNYVTYFDSFGVENIPKEIRTFINNKNIKTNIFRIKVYDSIMCGCFCIRFICFMLVRKTLTKYTSLFCQINFKKKRWYNFKLFYGKFLKIGVNEVINNSLKL